MSFRKSALSLLLMSGSMVLTNNALAGANAGDREIGGNVSIFGSSEEFKDSGTVFANASYGYYMTDALLLGVQAFATGSIDNFSETGTYGLSVGAQYHFLPDATVTPYVGAGVGVQSSKDESAFGVDLRGGVKAYVSEDVSLEAELAFTRSFSDELEDSGFDKTLQFSVGINYVF